MLGLANTRCAPDRARAGGGVVPQRIVRVRPGSSRAPGRHLRMTPGTQVGDADLRTEAAVMEAMHRLMRGRTTFLITHRVSTLFHCDTRLQVEEGRWSDSGASAERLLATAGPTGQRAQGYRRYRDRGDALATTFSPRVGRRDDLRDRVAEGDKIPRKGSRHHPIGPADD